MTESHIIIGVHGLANKPPEDTLTGWWRESIIEGLKRNEKRQSEDIAFDLVYWAHHGYDNPIPDSENKEPYKKVTDGDGPFPTYKDGWWDDVVAGFADVAATPLDWAKRYFGIDEIADAVLGAKLKDLGRYYENKEYRDNLRKGLKEKLDLYAGKRIMVIAHSMGSIIAYDVLRRYGRDNPSARIDHLITIGSPLGLPHVKYKIYQENDRVRTPTVVAKWTNLADRRDPVAADVHLAGDYAGNDRGVEVRDDLVINGYVSPEKEPNYHKSYGYLRTPEISSLIRSFI